MTHTEKLEKSVKATNFSEVLHIVAQRAEDELILLKNSGANQLNVVLSVGFMASGNEINFTVVSYHNTKGVRQNCLVTLQDDSFNFCTCELVFIFNKVVLDCAGVCCENTA